MRASPAKKAATRCSSTQVFHFAEQEYSDSLTEFHIVGGLNPDLPFELLPRFAARIEESISVGSPESIHDGRAGLLREDHAQAAGVGDRAVARAGMGSCPGGGAEIFAERARPLIAGHKISGARWLEVARAVHKMGIRSNATMLYGHIETLEERVDHLVRLRELQDETGGFNCFIPLAFHPEHTVYAHLPTTTRHG